MAFEFTYENSRDLIPFVVLLIDLFLMMIILRTREKMKKRIMMSLGLTATYTAALTVMNLLSEYTLDVKHILSHVLLSAILLLCAKLLLTEKVPAFFHPFILLELNVFDRFQYSLAQTMMSLASTLRKAQTGNLNLNMLGVVIGLIICFILLLLLGLMRF